MVHLGVFPKCHKYPQFFPIWLLKNIHIQVDQCSAQPCHSRVNVVPPFSANIQQQQHQGNTSHFPVFVWLFLAILLYSIFLSLFIYHTISLCCCSAIQWCSTLCNPMDCSTPGFPMHHQLLELAQTHVHQVSDAIQLSHPLLSPSPPAFNLSEHQGFSNQSALCIRWPNFWSFSYNVSPSNDHPRLISFRMDWLDLLAVQGTLVKVDRHKRIQKVR